MTLEAKSIDPVLHMVLRMRAAAMKSEHPAWCWTVDPLNGSVCVADEHTEEYRHTWQVSPWEASLIETDE